MPVPKNVSAQGDLQKCTRTSFSKVKLTKETCKIGFHEHEDRELFVQISER